MADTLARNVPATPELIITRDKLSELNEPGGLTKAYAYFLKDQSNRATAYQLALKLGATIMKCAVDPEGNGEDKSDWEIIASAQTVEVIQVRDYNFIALIDGEPFLGIVEPYQRHSIYLRPFTRNVSTYTD